MGDPGQRPATVVTVPDRRRLLTRQLAPVATVEEAVDAVLALHASDPASVYLSVLARCPTASVEDVAGALHERRSLVRVLGMRRTLFVVRPDVVPVVHAAAGLDVAARLRRRLVGELSRLPTDPAVSGDVEAWLDDVLDGTERALAARGTATAAQLAEDEPRLRTVTLPVTDRPWDLRRALTSRVLTLLAAQGRAVRGRSRGAWTSRAPTWEPVTTWWPAGLPDLDPAAARADLARRWLQVFGPALPADLQWWTGWSKSVTTRVLADLSASAPGGLVEVDLAGEAGVDLAEASGPARPEHPGRLDHAADHRDGVVLLPALDPTPMGWKHRAWFLPEDPRPLFDTNGNIGPTVWWRGEVVGGWAVRGDGEVVHRLLADRGAEASAATALACSGLTARLGGTAVAAAFPTPLERELRSS